MFELEEYVKLLESAKKDRDVLLKTRILNTQSGLVYVVLP